MDSVFQSYIEYLPKEPLLNKYGKIESIFEISENPNQILRPIYYGTFRTEIENIWKEYKLAINEITKELEKFNINKISTFDRPIEEGKFMGIFSGNYCSIKNDLKTNQINHFQFGIDITKRETIEFVNTILEFASNKKLILLGSNLKTFEPTKEEIDKYFRNSPAYKMLKTEEEFLKRVESGKEKTDVPFMTLKK